MKKIFSLILIFVFMLSFAGCGSDNKNAEQPKQEVKKVQPVVDEKVAYQNFKAAIQNGLVAVDNDWATLWTPTITNYASGSLDEKTAFQTLKQLENNLINDEMLIYNAPVDTNISQETQSKMSQIKNDYQQWIQQRRKSSENFRQALATGQITAEKIQETIDMINRADAIMMGATGKLAELENKFKN